MSDASVAELFQETEIKPGMGENILTQRLILHTYQSQCRTGKNVGLSDKDTSTIPVCFDTLQNKWSGTLEAGLFYILEYWNEWLSLSNEHFSWASKYKSKGVKSYLCRHAVSF